MEKRLEKIFKTVCRASRLLVDMIVFKRLSRAGMQEALECLKISTSELERLIADTAPDRAR